eukprot:gnl/MRDRNA2_/MRDRNA2_42071_c0_seq1.p1 gnl/MRDRNA2_/MRDRNA2_42071_c0~~gnl/MRDRNA2_/MRDRNA2_42071_c0_seq1.p1  ORF type:complete len:284 (+),score=53.10 gnl/MRDRNA2_/MRDRNA2_42071_c0_seq1:101-952(+)
MEWRLGDLQRLHPEILERCLEGVHVLELYRGLAATCLALQRACARPALWKKATEYTFPGSSQRPGRSWRQTFLELRRAQLKARQTDLRKRIWSERKSVADREELRETLVRHRSSIKEKLELFRKRQHETSSSEVSDRKRSLGKRPTPRGCSAQADDVEDLKTVVQRLIREEAECEERLENLSEEKIERARRKLVLCEAVHRQVEDTLSRLPDSQEDSSQSARSRKEETPPLSSRSTSSSGARQKNSGLIQGQKPLLRAQARIERLLGDKPTQLVAKSCRNRRS